MSNRTIHDEFCEGDIHTELDVPLEACYSCEEILTCKETFRTSDPMYPVICEECKF
jgi:hypothetical protein